MKLNKDVRLKAHRFDEQTLMMSLTGSYSPSIVDQSQEELFRAIEQVTEIIMITDAQEKIVYVNPAFEKITGFSKEEALGHKPNILKSGKIRPAQYLSMWQTVHKGEPWKGIFINKKKSGEYFHEEASITPILNSQHEITHYVAIKRDITKELKLNEHLEQRRKVEAIGFLAGGIAHEFNNIIAGIMGYAQMSQQLTESGSTLEKYITMIVKSTERAIKVVEKIENYTSSECSEMVQVNLSDILEELLSFVQKTTPPTVIYHSTYADRILPVAASPTKIHEALLNILSNAIYAINKDGEIELFLHSESLTQEVVTAFNIIPSGVYTIIEISDNGCGIHEEAIKSIFDPFYTTRSLDSGSGMGLAVVSGIMKSHNGFIDVQSSIGLGTVIKLYFPVSKVHIHQSSLPFSDTIPKGAEAILLVEDEKFLLDIMKEMLRSLGYKVTAFTNPLKALEEFNINGDNYDLIYTDYLMPYIDGIELASKIRETDSLIPIILSTGNSDEINQERAEILTSILKKPQRLEEIAKELESIFRQKRQQ